MFGWLLPDPVKRLRRRYEAKLAEAMQAQRSGDIQRYAELTAEAAELHGRLNSARSQREGR